MKIGIYNRWLHTLGGGEKHSLAIASLLSKTHDVEVISHKNTIKSRAEERLNLDLSKVKFLFIPDRPALEISELTNVYDLFINSSFMDFFPSFSKKSLNLIFFPAKIEELSFIKTKHKIGRIIKIFFSVPYVKQGVKKISIDNKFYNYIVEDNFSIELPIFTKIVPMVLSVRPLCNIATKVQLIINGIKVDEQFCDCEQIVNFNFHINPLPKRQILTIHVYDHDNNRVHTELGLDRVMLNNFRYNLFTWVFETKLKNYGLRLQQLPFESSDILKYLNTYDITLANSKFTQFWIKKYWNIESKVLYPLIDVESFSSGIKQKKILTIGRFFAGGHNKKHNVIVKTFKEMVDNGLQDWELNLVGGSTPGDVHKKYLEDLIQEANGYPIKIHVDAAYSTMVDLLQNSSIYWHASGYGENELENPVRFEHFGITTVEAMASGAVPVVINKGGQPEIINHGVNGYLWDDIESLQKYTLQLINNPNLISEMSKFAVIDSQRFNSVSFESTLNEILNKIGFGTGE